ncbi:transketolase [Seleniivibrio sp.]|uniref:transketolase n=1 Tax=Seleniivibrio sp. TaxID=2898801 RepID=UPI0025DF019C|nr:transketolase [Seleniivibrio sp.]MCD8554286.1 transketolase [Seleniivibrio sp.]
MTSSYDAAELKNASDRIRYGIIKNSSMNHVPHLGSCLSCTDILATLHLSVMSDDDIFLLSKGHAAPALYFVLAEKGIISKKEMEDYGSDGSLFGEHPPAHGIKGIHAATGSLGHGLPILCGMALAAKIKDDSRRFYTLLGDGECNEGSIWEAVMFASAKKLSNVTAIIDFNKWQATDRSREIMPLEPFADKFRSFGWETAEIDGHDHTQIFKALAPADREKPLVIIAHTVKGKGVSFMEDDNNWHYRTPSKDEVAAAAKELGAANA